MRASQILSARRVGKKCTALHFSASVSRKKAPRRRRIGLGQIRRRGDRIRFDGTVQAPAARTKTSPEASSQQLLRMPDSPQLDHPPPPPADQKSAAASAQPNLLVPVKPTMIIKGVLGRYERWNPVHPTAGAFWGIGLGLGCGVGWGPGFGPEVIGYVGSGCGVGFSVGFTLAGVGIGLPQHGLIKSLDNSDFPSNMPLESARYYTMTIIRGLVRDAIGYASRVPAVRKELLKFQDNSQVSGGVDLPKLGNGVSSTIQSNRRS